MADPCIGETPQVAWGFVEPAWRARRSAMALPACAILAFGVACAPPRALPEGVPAPAFTARLLPAPTSPPAATPSAIESAPPQAPLDVTFHREVEAPILAIALAKPPHVAALGSDAAWIHDARGWRSEQLPASARPPFSVELAVFYGRDFRARVVGTRTREGEAEAVYLRWIPGGFRAAATEIGRLGTQRGALQAVLGPADPEIVCRPGDTCIVKRATGWMTIAAPVDLRRVVLGGGLGWALAGQQLLRLDEGWVAVGPRGSWEAGVALFATRDAAWVIDNARSRLHFFDGTSWRVTGSPIEGPRALWGARADALWLVGDGGLAYFDGAGWRKAKEAPGPLAVVAGRRADDVWVAGARGLFRVDRTADR